MPSVYLKKRIFTFLFPFHRYDTIEQQEQQQNSIKSTHLESTSFFPLFSFVSAQPLATFA